MACGRRVERCPSAFGRNWYCSYACRSLAQARRHGWPGCKNCGVEIPRGKAICAVCCQDAIYQASLRRIPAELGSWIAGLIDGEGCFRVHRHTMRKQYQPTFSLRLRDDDTSILRWVARRTGIGKIVPNKVDPASGSKPGVNWITTTKADCVALVRLLDRCPLRTRKMRDYRIWRRAALYWAGHDKSFWRRNPRAWRRLGAYKAQIERARIYRGPSNPPCWGARQPKR